MNNSYYDSEYSDCDSESSDDDDKFQEMKRLYSIAEVLMEMEEPRASPISRRRYPTGGGQSNEDYTDHEGWRGYAEKLQAERMFESTFRMSYSAFCKLLSIVSKKITVDREMSSRRTGSKDATISPLIILHCTIRFLAGGSFLDIKDVINIGKSTFYACVHRGIKAINDLDELKLKFPSTELERTKMAAEFKNMSTGNIIKGCIGAIDGMLCPIQAPSSRETGNVRGYFSGHYFRFGLNVQAVCDPKLRFTFLAVNTPGSTHDMRAFRNCSLFNVVESLPEAYYLVGDNAYTITNHLLTPYSGNQGGDVYNDSFNFHLSQIRIRVEQAFGLLVSKWRILKRSMQVSLKNSASVIHACARLHNFVINEQERSPSTLDTDISPVGFLPSTVTDGDNMALTADFGAVAPIQGYSHMRQVIRNYLRDMNIRRPEHNINRNS